MNTFSKQELGARIRDLRVKNDISQEELGKVLQKSHAAISDIERGKTEVSVNDLSLIAQRFNTSVGEILSSPVQASSGNLPYLSLSRADRNMSDNDRMRMKKAREEFMRKAREASEENE